MIKHRASVTSSSRRGAGLDLRRISILNLVLNDQQKRETRRKKAYNKRGSNTISEDIIEEDQQHENDDGTLPFSIAYSKSVMEKLERNDENYDHLELGPYMSKGAVYADLLRALSSNTHLQRVLIKEEFLEPFDTEEKSRILLEVIGRLPKLQSLHIHFPNRMNGSAASLLCSVIRNAAANLKSLVVTGLRLVEEGEEDELAEAFEDLKHLTQLHLLDFVVLNDVDSDPFLETVGELPVLEDFELRMKRKESEISGMFFESLCQSTSLHSLVLWNMKLDMVQVTHFCENIQKSTSLKHLELWRCDLGPTFGILLSEMVRENISLEKIIISHVGFYGSGVVALTNALKRNTTLRELRLYSVGKGSEATVAKAAVNMMNANELIKRVSFAFDELSEDGCIELDKTLRKNAKLEQIHNEKLSKQSPWKVIFYTLFGITMRY